MCPQCNDGYSWDGKICAVAMSTSSVATSSTPASSSVSSSSTSATQPTTTAASTSTSSTTSTDAAAGSTSSTSTTTSGGSSTADTSTSATKSSTDSTTNTGGASPSATSSTTVASSEPAQPTTTTTTTASTTKTSTDTTTTTATPPATSTGTTGASSDKPGTSSTGVDTSSEKGTSTTDGASATSSETSTAATTATSETTTTTTTVDTSETTTATTTTATSTTHAPSETDTVTRLSLQADFSNTLGQFFEKEGEFRLVVAEIALTWSPKTKRSAPSRQCTKDDVIIKSADFVGSGVTVMFSVTYRGPPDLSGQELAVALVENAALLNERTGLVLMVSKVTQADASTRPSSSSNSDTIIFAAAGGGSGLLLIAIVIFIVYKRRSQAVKHAQALASTGSEIGMAVVPGGPNPKRVTRVGMMNAGFEMSQFTSSGMLTNPMFANTANNFAAQQRAYSQSQASSSDYNSIREDPTYGEVEPHKPVIQIQPTPVVEETIYADVATHKDILQSEEYYADMYETRRKDEGSVSYTQVRSRGEIVQEEVYGNVDSSDAIYGNVDDAVYGNVDASGVAYGNMGGAMYGNTQGSQGAHVRDPSECLYENITKK
eukprot:Colp12_sorted_trinity150504_noHs@11748